MEPQASQPRVEEWRAIQKQLRELLALHVHSGLDDGCQLIDEDFGTYEQKILVFHRDAVSPSLLEAMQELLSGYSREWRVLMLSANKDGTLLRPLSGVEVSAVAISLLPRQQV